MLKSTIAVGRTKHTPLVDDSYLAEIRAEGAKWPNHKRLGDTGRQRGG